MGVSKPGDLPRHSRKRGVLQLPLFAMKILAPLIFVVAAATTGYCADITYSESNKPADTTAITVSGGTATMAGVQAFRNNLKRHWAFDAAGDGFKSSNASSLPMLSITIIQ